MINCTLQVEVQKVKFVANHTRVLNMALRVLKFGGTSVGTPENVQSVVSILKIAAKQNRVVCVVSAFSGVTDKLIAVARLASSGDKQYEQLYFELRNLHNKFIEALISKEKNSLSNLIADKFDQLHNVLHGIYLIKELTPKTLPIVELLSMLKNLLRKF